MRHRNEGEHLRLADPELWADMSTAEQEAYNTGWLDASTLLLRQIAAQEQAAHRKLFEATGNVRLTKKGPTA